MQTSIAIAKGTQKNKTGLSVQGLPFFSVPSQSTVFVFFIFDLDLPTNRSRNPSKQTPVIRGGRLATYCKTSAVMIPPITTDTRQATHQGDSWSTDVIQRIQSPVKTVTRQHAALERGSPKVDGFTASP